MREKVTEVRIDEVVASIALVSGGFGIAQGSAVVKDLKESINATEKAVLDAIVLAEELDFIVRDGVWLRLYTRTEEAISQRLSDIANRLQKYEAHKNDPYVYYPGEIAVVREFLENAPSDVDFLLKLIAFRAEYRAGKQEVW
jgi:hypothetical protein